MLVTWHYRVRNSLMEKIDPRTRWIFSLVMLLAITFFWDIRFLGVLAVIGIAWYASARIAWREIRQAWRFVTFILIMMIVVNTIITSGGTSGIIPKITHPIWTITWPFHFTLSIERVVFAVAQILRVGAISAIFLIIPYSMDPRLYGFTFRGLGLPDRFAYSMDLAFRYVPTLARDFSVTFDAQKARGYELERVQGGLLEQVRKIAPLIVPVTMNSIMSGEDVTNAMDLRCFGIGPRTWVETCKFRPLDYVLMGFAVVIFIAAVVLHFGFHLGGFWTPPFLIH